MGEARFDSAMASYQTSCGTTLMQPWHPSNRPAPLRSLLIGLTLQASV